MPGDRDMVGRPPCEGEGAARPAAGHPDGSPQAALSGTSLAPNTQYQVTIGPGAKTASGKPLSTPQTITFVTKTPTTPTATPTPRPTPASALGEKQVAGLGGATSLSAQWSSDSSSVYYIDGHGALNVVPARGG